jgi:hypothetical protein
MDEEAENNSDSSSEKNKITNVITEKEKEE